VAHLELQVLAVLQERTVLLVQVERMALLELQEVAEHLAHQVLAVQVEQRVLLVQAVKVVLRVDWYII
jgi:hypothetical protein